MMPELSAAMWSAETYSSNAGHHRAYDHVFLDGLDLPSTATILDIGCGSGEFTRRLAGLVPAGRVVGGVSET